LHVSYEYILAGLIIILILTTSELTIFSLMTEKLTDIRQEGSYSTAEKIVDVLLLSPGYPFDWGLNVSVDPDSLGLALHNSLDAYVLDPEKVNRLNENSSGYIIHAKARELLGLRKDYHFSLQIAPMLDVQIKDEGDGEYSFAIFNDKGYSAANVNVTAFYIPHSFVPGIDYTSKSNITMIDGTCILDFDYQTNYMIVVKAEQAGVKVIATYPYGENFRFEDGNIFEGDSSLITEIVYSTSVFSGYGKESVKKYVSINGMTYSMNFDLWGV
jgi:hypothetical protein